MSPMSSAHCQNGRWFMQSHGMCCMWFRILLVVYERNKRFALFKVSLNQKFQIAQKCFHFWFSLICSPSGCTFWGKKPWSRKKKLLWQLGTLVGAPVGIALVAGIAVPAMIIGNYKCRNQYSKLIQSTDEFNCF